MAGPPSGRRSAGLPAIPSAPGVPAGPAARTPSTPPSARRRITAPDETVGSPHGGRRTGPSGRTARTRSTAPGRSPARRRAALAAATRGRVQGGVPVLHPQPPAVAAGPERGAVPGRVDPGDGGRGAGRPLTIPLPQVHPGARPATRCTAGRPPRSRPGRRPASHRRAGPGRLLDRFHRLAEPQVHPGRRRTRAPAAPRHGRAERGGGRGRGRLQDGDGAPPRTAATVASSAPIQPAPTMASRIPGAARPGWPARRPWCAARAARPGPGSRIGARPGRHDQAVEPVSHRARCARTRSSRPVAVSPSRRSRPRAAASVVQ